MRHEIVAPALETTYASLRVDSLQIVGVGLHGGQTAALQLRASQGAVRFVTSASDDPIPSLLYDGSRRSTEARSRDGRLRVATVEHLFAALGGAFIHEGVAIELDGPEVPLADGGAAVFFDALCTLRVPTSKPSLRVTRAGAIDVGQSHYTFEPPRGARDVHVEVEVDFGDPRLEPLAEWGGDPSDFRERIAPARTFGFAHEVEALMSRGLASFVAPESVVVIAKDDVLWAGRPFSPDEPARHKLLDLIGDLYAHGGPCLGRVRAVRPGHAATHEAVRRALLEGILVREPRPSVTG